MKKAQVEFIGFMIIISIVVLVLVSFFIISLKKQPESLKTIYSNKQIVTNTLDVILKTDVKSADFNFKKTSMEEWIRVCIKKTDAVTGSCSSVKSEIEKLLEYAFKDKGMDYEFEVSKGTTNYILIGTGCSDEKTAEAIFLDDISTSDYIEITFSIC